MLNRTVIRGYTSATTYNKGLDLYRGNKIKEFSVEEADDYHLVSAVVKGSGRKIYDVHVKYDVKDDAVEGVSCECPAFYSYSGICKHCVAVLLEYLDWMNRQHTIFEYARKQEESLERLHHMQRAGQLGMQRSGQPGAQRAEKRTTPAFRQMLEQRQKKSASAIMEKEQPGSVRLQPILICETDGHAYVEFKIGISQMYVLKDIFAFMNAVKSGEHISYGQKLAFVHRKEMFEPESVAWIDFMNGWILDHAESYMQGAYSLPKLRRARLNSSDLDTFLDIMGEREFQGEVSGSGILQWRVTQEALPRTLRLSGSSQGVELTINYLYGIIGNKYYHYFHEGKVYRVPAGQVAPIRDFISCMAQVPQRKVFIRKEDVPMFCRELLPVLEENFQCTKETFDEREYGVIPASFAFYLDAPQRNLVTCRPAARYGEAEYPVFGNREDAGKRDFAKEAEIAKVVSDCCDVYDEAHHAMAVTEDERIYGLITQGIPRLQMLGEVFISDALKRIQVTPTPKVTVGISVAGEIMELRMTAGDMTREQLLEILSKYSRKRRFFRLKNGDFIDMEGDDIRGLAELRQGLGLTDTQMRQKTVEIPKYRAMFLDAELRGNATVAVQKDKAFRALVRNMKTVDDNDFEIPSGLDEVLREYQKRGFLWIKTLKHNGFGGILADDMGLGKTLQVIAFLQSELAERQNDADNRDNVDKKDTAASRGFRALIISPASLVYNWNSEIRRFAPDLPVRMIVGTAGERKELIEGAGETEIFLTSYDLLKRDIAYYEPILFDCQIIDEAQYIKNHSTQAAKAVKQVRAGFRLALTGTPVENRLSELWSIFDYLMPGFLYSYQKFREEIEAPIVQEQDENAMKRLQKMIRPFVLRRLKRDVLTDLPAKIEKNFFAKMEGEQQKLYDAHVKRIQLLLDKQSDEEFSTSKIQILSELTRLRQICCDPALVFEGYTGESAKTDTCMELIRNAVGSGHKILLFSQFTSMLERIRQQLDKEQISYYVLTGSTSKEKRVHMVEDFNRDETSVFCISLKAGGTGLNLTAADIVIHFDPWWNLAVQNQATDRAHRIGQEQVVTVYKLLAQGTIEENIMKLQEKKRELAEEILGGEGLKSGSFSREELMELLKR